MGGQFALGGAGRRILTNETSSIEPLALKGLLPLAQSLLAGRLPLFGIHPDLETEKHDPWAELDWVKPQVGQENYVGAFSTIDKLRHESHRTSLLQTLEKIVERGAEPVVGIGYGAKIEGTHPFDDRVQSQRQHDAQIVMQTLESLGSAVTVRLFYEMNLPAFVYGRNRELSHQRHVRGYQRAFTEFANARSAQSKVKLSFNPAVQNMIMPEPFREYWPTDGGEPLADSAGIDAYHLFPGKGKFFHPYYWFPGQYTPETALLSSFAILNELTEGKVPWMVWEIGSLAKDAEWLSHALLLTLAHGGQGVMHFNYDKSGVNQLYEGDWRINESIAAGYQQMIQRISVSMR